MTTTPSVQFEPIKPSSASDLVFEAMRSAIFSGALQPGAALRELHLARELKVSQATVREGLLQLECAHLAVRVPNKGTYVAALSPSEIHERCIVRTHLEQHAAIEAAARLSPEEFDILQQRAEEISRLTSENSYYEVEKVDLEFHRFIWQKSGNTLLSRILEQVTIPLFAYICVCRSRSRANLTAVVRPHEPLVAALRSREDQAIAEAVREHIELSYGRYISSDEDGQSKASETLRRADAAIDGSRK